METTPYHERYNYKPLADVNTLPEDDDYVINTNPEPAERFVIKVGEYRNLRNVIIKHLLTFYDRVDYCDADIIKTYLSMRGYKDDHLFTFVFYIEEWHCYQQTGVFQEMITQYLAWGISNYHRNNTGTLFPRLKTTHALTKYSVLRDEKHRV